MIVRSCYIGAWVFIFYATTVIRKRPSILKVAETMIALATQIPNSKM